MSSPFNVQFVRKTGITVLFEPKEQVEPIVDIVFVHGLQGHPRNTWTWESNVSPQSKESKKDVDTSQTAEPPARTAVFWPYHLLHEDCPNSRILTWGYDSNVSHFFDGSANKNNILSHSRDLLGDLNGERGLCPNRQLIFVAHSLGGIIVKQMLLRASRSDTKSYQDLFKSTNAVLFLGTPHAGSRFAELGDTLRGIMGAIGFDTGSQNLRALKPDSALLEQCREDFYTLYLRRGFEVYTFQEARGMKSIGMAGLSDKVVPDASSEFLGSEKRFTIDANHMTMCRYSSREDDGYRKVGRELRFLCQSIQALHEKKLEEKRNIERDKRLQLDANQIDYLNSLAYEEMDYRQQEVLEAHSDSCNWILDHKFYKEWKRKGRGLLGIKGKPGSGKSTLMKKIFQHYNKEKTENHIQLSFFFHRRGTSLQQTSVGMFRTLLYQLLSQIPSVGDEFWDLCEKKKRWQGDPGKEWNWRAEELRETFSSALLAAAKCYAVGIFIDALDEAGDKTAQDIIAYLYEISDRLSRLEAATAICFSCRHFPILPINDGFEICLEQNNNEDIAAYTLAELRRQIRILDKANSQEDILLSLQADIAKSASGVFLWVALVVPMVAKQYNAGKSMSVIHRLLKTVPSVLGDVYRYILTKLVDPEDRIQTLHLMQWVFLAERPLSVTELRFAMASDDSSVHPSQYSCQDSEDFIESDTRMTKLIVSLSGGLAEVKHHAGTDGGYYASWDDQYSKVQFIHQSVNDFLSKDKFKCLELAFAEDLIGHGHHRLARSCLNYLLLEEIQKELGSLNNPLSYQQESLQNDFPFIAYATTSWFVHAEKAESLGVSQQDLLQRFKWPSYQLFESWVKISCKIYRPSHSRPAVPGATLLHIAAASNLQTTVKSLLENGVQVEEEDEEGDRAVHYAARFGHAGILSILLGAHAQPEAENENHRTPLDCAARAGNEAVVRLLIKRGVDVKHQTGNSGGALQEAAVGGNVAVVQLLLIQGAEVNAQGGKYGNALQAAACWGHEALVKLLLEQGAEVNTQGGPYGNALQAAAFCGHEAVVKLLLEQGAEVNTQGGLYGNALQIAAYQGHEAIVMLLLEQGAEVNMQGGPYGNALQAAAFYSHEALVKLLLEQGAEVNAQGGPYGNALQAVACQGHEALVKLLLEQGAEVNTQGGPYGNALQMAAYQGHEAIVKLLLEQGAEINAQGGQYGNALQAAAFKDHEAIVKLLLERGAEVNAHGGQHGSALRAAKIGDNDVVIQLLQEYGAAEGQEEDTSFLSSNESSEWY